MLTQITDIHVDVASPASAVIFPNQRKVTEGALLGFVFALASAIKKQQAEHPDLKGFVATVAEFGVRFRVQQIRPGRYAARKMQLHVPSLMELQLRQPYIDHLMKPEHQQTGGLILISGLTGSGKTTTAVATLVERLKRFGGYSATLEDPPEFLIEGHIGTNGYCEQIDITGQPLTTVQEMLLRIFPAKDRSMLLYGEVRSAAAAADLLRTAINGHLVIATVHAKDVITALQRLTSMASNDGSHEAYVLLAMALKLVFHQRLELDIPQVTILENTQRVANLIQKGDLQMLNDDVQRANMTTVRSVNQQP